MMSSHRRMALMASIAALVLAALAAPSLAARVPESSLNQGALELKGRSLLQTNGTGNSTGNNATVATYPSIPAALQALNRTALLQAANQTNLTATLADPNANYIILAPSNEAFGQLQQQYPNITSNPIFVKAILAYHVLQAPGPVAPLYTEHNSSAYTLLPAGTFLNASTRITYKNVTVGMFDSNDFNFYYAGGVPYGTYIQLNDSVAAGNSRIYPIDTVLIPPAKELLGAGYPLSLVEYLASNPDLSSLVALAQADPQVLALVQNPDVAVTLLAPTNEAINALLAQYNATAASLAGSPAMHQILLNHVIIVPENTATFEGGEMAVPTLLSYADPGAGFLTVSGGSPTNATITSGMTNMTNTNMTGGGTSSARTTTANIMAGKSVVWVIDGVLVPPGLNLTNPNATLQQPPASPPGVFAPPPPATVIPGGPGNNGSTNQPPPPSAATLPGASLLLSAVAGMLALLSLA